MKSLALGLIAALLAGSAGAFPAYAPNSSGTAVPVQPVAPVDANAVSTSALAANLVVSNAPADLASFEVVADSTLSALAWYIQIYNATSAPADGAVTPAKCIPMPAGSLGGTWAFPTPINFSTGIVIGVSTTGCLTKTATTHALLISGDYR